MEINYRSLNQNVRNNVRPCDGSNPIPPAPIAGEFNIVKDGVNVIKGNDNIKKDN